MHDMIHAAIARDRVKELVEGAEAGRAARRPRDRRGAKAVPAAGQAPAKRAGRSAAAVLRLRPRLR
jgi:hypothetical protein